MFKCLRYFDSTHDYGWPRGNTQSCLRCGHQRPSKVQFEPTHSTAAIPRYEAKASEPASKVAVMRRKKARA